MIIYPKLTFSNNVSESFARRDVVVTDDGYAGVFFGGNLHYVSADGTLCLNDFPPSPTKITKYTELNGDIRFYEMPVLISHDEIPIPENEDLYQLASMGVDAAVVSLRIRSRSDHTAQDLYSRSLKLRSRYQKIHKLTYSEASEYYKRLKILDPIVAQLNTAYFTTPFGSGHFHSTISKGHAFSVSEYLSKDYETFSIPTTLSEKTAHKFIIMNIFFQNSIKLEHAGLFLEQDRLNYEHLNSQSSPFSTHSNELFSLCKKMTTDTKSRFKKMANEAIYRLASNKALTTNFTAPKLHENSKNLSIFCASQFSRDANDKRRIKSFHDAGARKLAHLLNIP